MCAPLVWLGLPTPVIMQAEFAAGPTSDSAKLEALVTAWRAVFGDDPITGADLPDTLRARSGEGKYRTLLDALKHAGIRTDNAVTLGLALRRLIGRTSKAGWSLCTIGKTRENAIQWAVSRAGE